MAAAQPDVASAMAEAHRSQHSPQEGVVSKLTTPKTGSDFDLYFHLFTNLIIIWNIPYYLYIYLSLWGFPSL